MLFQCITGLIVFSLFAWLIGEKRSEPRLKTIVLGLSVQFVLAVLLLKLSFFKEVFLFLNKGVIALENATTGGTSFVFGYLGGGTIPFDEKFPGAGFILAFRALPLVLVVSALSSLLFYLRVLPVIVRTFSFLLQKTMDIGGAVGLGTAANIFLGMIESPLFIRPYLRDLTRSELFTIMTCGMATIAGTVMILYASILKDVIPGVMGHILAASIISAPAAITVARLMIPETEESTSGGMAPATNAKGFMDAIATGTGDGVKLLINITAMLIVMVALISLVNQILGVIPDIGDKGVTLQRILGFIMSPVVWLMGIPWSEAPTAGGLMGTKTILNEFLAYLDLSQLPEDALSPKSRLIMTYAMCGFANFGSLGIMIGGIGSMAPERRDELISLGLKSIVAGTIATCMTGSITGILISF